LRKLRGAAGVGAAIGICAAFLCLERPGLLERGEAWTHDVRARRAARPAQAAKDIVLVDVGEQDIIDVERNFDLSFPWPRALFGYLTRHIAAGGPRAIVFDWFFQGRGALGVGDAAEFAEAMKESGRSVIGLYLAERPRAPRRPPGPWGAEVRTFATRAEALDAAQRLLAFDRVPFVLGNAPATLLLGGEESPEAFAESWSKLAGLDELAGVFPRDGEVPPARRLSELELAGLVTDEKIVAEAAGLVLDAPEVAIREQATLDPPLPILATAARLGNVVQRPDPDGVLRRHSPFMRHGPRAYPSLPLAAWMTAHPGVTPGIEGRELVLGDARIPLDEDGRFVIRYHGGNELYPRFSAYQVLQSFQQVQEGLPPVIPSGVFKDKYVVVSATASALVDVRVSPVARVHLGAAISANALDNLEAGEAIARAGRGVEALVAFGLALLMAVGVVVIWISVRATPAALVATLGVTLLALGGYWVGIDALYASRGVWLAAATPMGGAALASFAAVMVSTALERSDRRFVEKALNRYTSKALTRELMEHPEYLALGGARRDISVYFSDIAGFTTISEKLSAEDLVELLNEYLTTMTDIVDAHDGYVDKYIGDAVMAFWGGLIPDRDHARKAVRAAIAMRAACVRLAPGWKRRYGVEVAARAGINSGEGIVGNMGSQNKYNYTAMGDMVNIASRLEGANKPYGTYLMISDATYAHVRESIDARELDLMTVKGKERPIIVYEVLGETGATDATLLSAVERYHEGLRRYRTREFAAAIAAFEEALAIRPEDGPSAMYLERCRVFLADPPPADWDGVWHMKEK
jgi:adenylate cyclase